MPDLKTIYEAADIPVEMKHALGLQAVWDAGFKAGADQKPTEAPAITLTDADGKPVDPATLNA